MKRILFGIFFAIFTVFTCGNLYAGERQRINSKIVMQNGQRFIQAKFNGLHGGVITDITDQYSIIYVLVNNNRMYIATDFSFKVYKMTDREGDTCHYVPDEPNIGNAHATLFENNTMLLMMAGNLERGIVSRMYAKF